MYRVADQIVEILEKAGVKRIYGIVGDSLNPVTDALRRRKTIEWIHVRHEEVAAFAASAAIFLFYILSYQLDSLTRTKNRLSDTKPSDYSQKMTN